jgi:beta-phosphoglucomutase
MKYKGIIFDLDGVICSTDEYHYLAWKALAERLNIPFDRERNNLLRGVSRAASLNIILEKAIRPIRMKKKRLLLKKRTRCTGNCWAICRRPICPMM